MAATGEKIKALRKKNGLTVRELKEIFGFSTEQAIYKWESGYSMPTLDNMVILARVFQTTIDDIIVIRNIIMEKAG